MREFYEKNKDKLLPVVVFVLFSTVLTAFLLQYIAPFIFAFLFALAIEPLVIFMQRRCHMPRWLAALFCLAGMAALVLIAGIRAATAVWREARAFATHLPDYINELASLFDWLPVTWAALAQMIPIRFESGGTISRLPYLFINVVVFFVASIFFIKDKAQISLNLRRLTPLFLHAHLHKLKKGFSAALGGYVKAQAIIMAVIAVINALALTALSHPYPLFLAFVIALLDALPFLGSGLILWPWAAILFLSDDIFRAVAVVALYGVNLLTRQFMEPKILSGRIGLHPLVVLMSIYIGLRVFGPIGIFAGPIIAVGVRILSTDD